MDETREQAKRMWQQLHDIMGEAPYREAAIDIIAAALTEKDREIAGLRSELAESVPMERVAGCEAEYADLKKDRDRCDARAERIKIKFMDIRSKAWNEMNNPTGMHMTCLSLIHKIAVAALEDER